MQLSAEIRWFWQGTIPTSFEQWFHGFGGCHAGGGQSGISETESATVLEWFLKLLKTTLQRGEPIVIAGFGKFTVRVKAPRKGHNFQTGEALMISARRAVTFHPSVLFKTEMNAVSAERQEAGALPKGTG